jgi:cytochrome c biogenesis protein CcmG, thiol:disulfide interchange protein DsbE
VLRRVRRVLWVLVGIAIIASVGLALLRGRQGGLPTASTGSVASDQKSALVGRRLPSLKLTDLDGHPVSPDQLRGRPVLLNFWATWCIPCRAEMPEIQHEANVWGQRVAIAGVDDREDAATIRAFVSEIGVTYTIWRDPTSQVDSLLQAPGLPYSVFLDRQGVVRRIFLGQMSRQYIDDRLRELAK